jgi:hypothetical protein
MTYMFEYPQYIEVKLPDEIHQEFPRYKLFVYSEGDLAQYLEQRQFEGIPVLFIPGYLTHIFGEWLSLLDYCR